MGVENHKVPVVRITEVKKHPNADTLGIVQVLGYQAVVKLGNYKEGDLAIYIPPDSVVPEREQFAFLWADLGANDGKPIPEKKRRITARRFRKEWSEGLLLPVSDFFETDGDSGIYRIKSDSTVHFVQLSEDTDVADLLGITHYNPPEDELGEDNEKAPTRKQRPRLPKSAKGWFFFILHYLTLGLIDFNKGLGGSNTQPPDNTPPIYDVDAYKNFPGTFVNNESVAVTEKIHGSNARYMFVPSLFGLLSTSGRMYAGSRRLWKKPGSKCIWWDAIKVNPWIEKWCRNHPNHVLYGEVTPTQGEFTYGATKETPKFFPFDIRLPDGSWKQFDIDQWANAISQDKLEGIPWVPVLYAGPFSHEWIQQYVEGKSTVDGAKHDREGIVIRTVSERKERGLGRVQLKIVSNKFLEAQK